MTHGPILLASRSPRRRELLDQIRVPHVTRPADIDETERPGESPEGYVMRLAQDKAASVYGLEPTAPAALAADTTVALDGTIYGKPADRADGARMLRALSGRTHRVLTAVAVAHPNGVDCALSASEVTFAELDEELIGRYWETGEPTDKAGGYAVQGYAAVFIRAIRGSYSGIMGLPLFETAQLLDRAGIAHALRRVDR